MFSRDRANGRESETTRAYVSSSSPGGDTGGEVTVSDCILLLLVFLVCVNYYSTSRRRDMLECAHESVRVYV